MNPSARIVVDLKAKALTPELTALVAQLVAAAQQDHGAHSVRLQQVEYRPALRTGEDIWVRLPSFDTEPYVLVRMGPKPSPSLGEPLSAAAVDKLRQHGVCTHLRAEGPCAKEYLPAHDFRLEKVDALVGGHGFAVDTAGLNVQVSVGRESDNVCLCIRMPLGSSL